MRSFLGSSGPGSEAFVVSVASKCYDGLTMWLDTSTLSKCILSLKLFASSILNLVSVMIIVFVCRK